MYHGKLRRNRYVRDVCLRERTEHRARSSWPSGRPGRRSLRCRICRPGSEAVRPPPSVHAHSIKYNKVVCQVCQVSSISRPTFWKLQFAKGEIIEWEKLENYDAWYREETWSMPKMIATSHFIDDIPLPSFWELEALNPPGKTTRQKQLKEAKIDINCIRSPVWGRLLKLVKSVSRPGSAE